MSWWQLCGLVCWWRGLGIQFEANEDFGWSGMMAGMYQC